MVWRQPWNYRYAITGRGIGRAIHGGGAVPIPQAWVYVAMAAAFRLAMTPFSPQRVWTNGSCQGGVPRPEAWRVRFWMEASLSMTSKWKGQALLGALLALCLAVPAVAQITTGNVAGTIKDAQGGVIPGATVVLVSESRGTKSVPAVTDGNGNYVFANITPDTYTVNVTMPGFKALKRSGVVVTGGDRVAVGSLVLQVGETTESVDVTAEAPMIQAQSGERSAAISTEAIENLPINHGNFASFANLIPGVQSGGSTTVNRLGSSSQNNVMMDGISAMDTGNNGQMLRMNIESIAEVKVLTSGYQAEYGRSSGLQITAVTKSGSNRFHGSVYDLQTNSAWNTNSWVNQKNGDPKTVSKNTTFGYSLGGPVGKPGGNNKLFFFYSHEYRPSTSGGSLQRFRLPTALERAGNFSQTLDNQGKLFNTIVDPTTGQPFAGSQIPANRIYAPGLAILNQYPMPNITQAPGTSYNYEAPQPNVKQLTQQPAVRVDYQWSPALRITGKYSGQRQRKLVHPGRGGSIPGFNDALDPYPFITNYGLTVNYTLTPTTFFEATYGFIRNQLAGGGSGGILVTDASNRLGALKDVPLIYPESGTLDTRYYQYKVLSAINPPFFDGTTVNLPPIFSWGGRIGNAPPNLVYPGWLNINRTQDFAASITKVAGRHTFKAGFYNNHSYKAQNVGAGGAPSFQGALNFGNDTNNTLDSGFGYSNALLGVFDSYGQASKLIEGSFLYNNTEFYVQDNWKVNGRLTLDYGMRFTRQQPQYDQFQQSSNFFVDKWNPAAAPTLYVAGCSNGAVTCSGNTRNAMDPRSGQVLVVPGIANSQSAIGTPIPGSGDLYNGVIQAGHGISKYNYLWPNLVIAPRFGAAYDLKGDQTMVLRGGVGLFYDRPDGNTVFSAPSNPPYSTSTVIQYGQLQNLSGGFSALPVPGLITFQYNAQVPSSVQWNAGAQVALPWSSALDISYVGSHGYNRMQALQGAGGSNTIDLNGPDFGTAYLPQYQDATKGTSSVPGKNALPTNLLRPYAGLANVNTQLTQFHTTYHSIQTSFNRRFRNGFQFGVNYTLGLQQTGNEGLSLRIQHAADGTWSTRPDQAAYEALNKNAGLRRHTIRGNFVWDLPDLQADGGGAKVAAAILNDWQLSGVLTAGSAGPYDLRVLVPE